MSIINILNSILWSYVLIAVLILSGAYFTIKLNFLNITQISTMFKIMFDKETTDGISPFQAFCISAASKVGTGSIAGVALAISVGGPGSVFWMWILTLVVGSLSLIENTLAQIYKIKDKNMFIGGPAYYIELGMNNKYLAITFSILITITYGFIFNAVQANTIAVAFKHAYGIKQIYIAVFITLLTASIILGGAKRIAKVSQYIMPFMGALYLLIALFIVLKNITVFFDTFHLIIGNAFHPAAFGGGTFGVILMEGIKRGLFSNEAGMGSTPNAAASATTSHPFKQGLAQTLGVYITTLGVCSATAFIILFSGVFGTTNYKGVELTQAAMSSQMGNLGEFFLIICIFLFAFTSIIGNYFYGIVNIAYMKKTWFNTPFKFLALIIVFWGSLKDAPTVWALADLFMGLMALLNIYALFMLRKPAFECIKNYMQAKKSGVEPNFTKDALSNSKGVTCWDTSK